MESLLPYTNILLTFILFGIKVGEVLSATHAAVLSELCQPVEPVYTQWCLINRLTV